MVEILEDGRLKSDGTQVFDMAKVLPKTDKPREPLTRAFLDSRALGNRVRFDLPLDSFENLRRVGEMLQALGMQLEGLSYQRQRNETEVLREARSCVHNKKRKIVGW
ncbi:MAG TPA: hypothetical protein VEA41_04645 [Salinarimonas sp.]|nr:hypothetical protein [Salinarimonas sp.]